MTALTTGHGRLERGDRRTVGRSVLQLVAAAVVLWAALCGIGWLLSHPLHGTAFEDWDGWVDRWFARHRTSTWNTVTHWATYAAETYTVIAIGVIFFIVLRLTLHRWRESMFLFAAVAGEVLIFVCTTLIIDRHRPAVPHLDDAPPTSSFPSGHTAASLALYGALAIIAVREARSGWLRGVAVTLAVLVPVCVAFARMYRGMHYPTDTMGGALLSIVWLTVTSRVLLSRRP
jgi:membrane-associated phospholipid phosphatase